MRLCCKPICKPVFKQANVRATLAINASLLSALSALLLSGSLAIAESAQNQKRVEIIQTRLSEEPETLVYKIRTETKDPNDRQISSTVMMSSKPRKNNEHDRKITEAVKERLAEEPDIPADAIHVETKDNNVRLSGTVPTQLQLNRMIELAHSVTDVKKVDASKLYTESSDSFLKDAILTAKTKGVILQMANDQKIAPGYDLHVETINGEVHMFGFVKNKEDAQTIVNRVSQIESVKSVKTNIRVIEDGTQ